MQANETPLYTLPSPAEERIPTCPSCDDGRQAASHKKGTPKAARAVSEKVLTSFSRAIVSSFVPAPSENSAAAAAAAFSGGAGAASGGAVGCRESAVSDREFRDAVLVAEELGGFEGG